MNKELPALPITYELKYPVEFNNSTLTEIVLEKMPTWGAVKQFPVGKEPTPGDFLPIVACMTAKITGAMLERLSSIDAFNLVVLVNPFTVDLQEDSKPSE